MLQALLDCLCRSSNDFRVARQAISKSTRFRILDRDGFACRYCGRRAPDVVLEVDHIVAVVNGGSNRDENLVSSCEECNRGKSDRPTILPLQPSTRKKVQKKTARSVAALNRKILKERDESDAKIKRWDDLWTRFGDDPVPGNYQNSLARIFRRLDEKKVLESIPIAYEKNFTYYRENGRFCYFCGICWNLIKEKETPDVCETVQSNS